jgi:fumarate reductase flavoprotein subunit
MSVADGGLNVALIEALETYRVASNSARTTGMIPAAGSRWQAEAGIEDDPDLFYQDIMDKTHGEAEPSVARSLVDVAPEVVHWLYDECGVPLELATDVSFPGHNRRRHHSVPERRGSALHGALLAGASRRPSVDLIVPMRLVDVTPASDGSLKTAVERPDGGREEITAGAVVLATNGFGADEELVRTYIPEIAEGLYYGGEGSTGDALRLGERLGADTGFLDSYQGHASIAIPHSVLVTWATVMEGGFVVNESGRRFGNEAAGYSEYAVSVLEQPEGISWVVYDDRIHRVATAFAEYQDLTEMGAIRWADDVDELAALMSVDAGALHRTFEAAGRYARREEPDPFGRTNWESELSPPYAAVRITGSLFHTQGGLSVDGRGAVLRKGDPIPGLYAVGGAAAGISGHGAAGYMSGNGLLSALGLGYLAGRAITA